MASDASWDVKDRAPEPWTDARVRATAAGERVAVSTPEDDSIEAMSARLELLTQQIERLAPKKDDRAVPERSAGSGRSAQDRAEDLAVVPDDDQGFRPTLSIRSYEPTAAGAVSPLSAPEAQPVWQSFDSFGLDQAIAEITARQHALDHGLDADPADPTMTPWFDPLPRPAPREATPPSRSPAKRDRLGELAEQLDQLRGPNGFGQALAGLRQDLGDIGRRLSDAAPRHALQAIEADVRVLADRIDAGRHRGADAVVLAGVERSLAEVRRALQEMAPAESLAAFRDDVRALDRKIEALVSGGADAASVDNLGKPISDLREVAARAASQEALVALAEEVQALSQKVDRLSGPVKSTSDVLSSLEQRFQQLSAALEPHPAEPVTAAENRNVIDMVEALTDRLERVEVARGSGPVIDQITMQLSRLSERLESSGARLASIDVVERGISELFDQLDGLHARTIATAEQAAREAVRGSAESSGNSGYEFEALKHDVDAMRQHQAQSDRRTQDTLEIVHDTLERLVDRLAMVETDLRGEPRGSASVDMLYPLARPSAGQAQGETRKAVAPPPIVQERRPIDPTLPGDHPIEPGSAAARSRSPATPAERIAISEALLGPDRTAAESEPKANFIAAARRAAQAAASVTEAGKGATAEGKSVSSTLGAIAQKVTGRRALMLALAAFVVAGTLHIVVNVIGAGTLRNLVAAQTTVSEAPKPTREPPKVVATRPATPPTPAATLPSPLASTASTSPAPQPIEREASREPASAARNTPPAPTSQSTTTVSPLAVASIQLPTGEVTGSTNRAAGFSLSNASPMPNLGAPDSAAASRIPNGVSAGLRSAALGGNPAAAYEMALMYAEGRGTPVNLEEAVRWFERAANQNITPAQYRLGSLYEKGQGVKKNAEKARQLYALAAEKGHGKAMHNLAVLHAEGIEGKPEFKMAAHWFRRAADRGVADSQYNLAILNARGLGVEQSLTESYKWFALAAQQGDQDAGKKRDEIAIRLDPQALAAAKLAVETFAPEPQPEDAVGVKAPAGGWDAPAASAPPAKPKAGARRPAAS